MQFDRCRDRGYQPSALCHYSVMSDAVPKPLYVAVEMIETESYVRARAERGFSHDQRPNQPLGYYMSRQQLHSRTIIASLLETVCDLSTLILLTLMRLDRRTILGFGLGR
jgi:hypothetical protein